MTTTDVSRNLAAILDMAARLEARAIDRAGDHAIPGGEAMVNLAGVANLADWARRNDLADDALLAYEDPDELWSPFQTLAFWSEQWRVELGMDHDDPRWRPSIATEAGFLRNPDVLAWAWDNELHWDDFAADVARAKTKLEAVLIEGERADRLRVVCPDCTDSIAEDAQNAALSDEQGSDGESHQCDSERPAERRTAPRLIAVYGTTRDADRWKCPTCRHRFTAEDVRRASASQMKAAGVAERWLPLADAISIIRRHGDWREKTIRSWAADDTEVSTKVERGVRMVWWPDMWRRHLLHRWEVNEARRAEEERAQRRAACARNHGADCWVHRRGCSRILARAGAV